MEKPPEDRREHDRDGSDDNPVFHYILCVFNAMKFIFI